MAARSHLNGWDPMAEDYNNESYDSQYPDNDNESQLVTLDHQRLYVTNIPPGLNETGIKTVFEKYGHVLKAFLSRDPQKRYALIHYETPGEARIAMMKLNKTEPLNMNVILAHAKPENVKKSRPQKPVHNKAASVVANNNKEKTIRNKEEIQVQDEEELEVEESVDFGHVTHLELEKIKLEKLKIQEEKLKCREKMMLLQLQKKPSVNNSPSVVRSSRRLLPDGRVIVQTKVQESDASFAAGGGDSPNIPGLQRGAEPRCLTCGARADLYCARCRVAPYCGEVCQRDDWAARHSAVCHNLARLNNPRTNSPQSVDTNTNNNVCAPSPPAPLRKPWALQNQKGPQRNGLPHNNNNEINNYNKSPEKKQPYRGPPTQKQNMEKTFFPAGHQIPPQTNDQRNMRPYVQKQTSNNREECDNTDKKPQPPRKTEPGFTNHNLKEPTFKKFTPKSETPQPKVEAPKPRSVVMETNHVPNVVNKAENLAKRAVPNTVLVKNTPEIALVPSQYLIEKLSIGDSFLLSVEQPAAACGTRQPGFVCLAMHADYQHLYTALMADIYDGENIIKPKPGSTFAYLNPADGGWYRARCLNDAQCALLDGSLVANMAEGQCRALAADCRDTPEFCCLFEGNAQVGMSLTCSVVKKSGDKYQVSVTGDGVRVGSGTVCRWLPDVQTPLQKLETAVEEPKLQTSEPIPQYSEPKPPHSEPKIQHSEPKPQVSTNTKPLLPEISRPDLKNNGRYLLLHVTSLARACVRACDDDTTAEFERVLQDAALYGAQHGQRLAAPPKAGATVLCEYEGAHYRALVVRTKAADNKYKVQYAEYGNEEIVTLEKLYACPPELDLSTRPARASFVALSDIGQELTEPATQLLDSLKEEAELILTTPSGAPTAPSGSLVYLSLAKNKENLTKKIEEMCTPEWKKLEQAGKDVVEAEVVQFSNLESLELPTARPFELDVTDFTGLERGLICGFEVGSAIAAEVYGPLTDRINEYCNSSLCSEPYLPMVEEVCLARLQPYPQWFRGVVVAHAAGAATATVLYIDYGTLSDCVPVADLRKCLPEFAKLPAVAANVLVQDWPDSVGPEQLMRALQALQVNDEGRGRLAVARSRHNDGLYVVEAPQLIRAIQ